MDPATVRRTLPEHKAARITITLRCTPKRQRKHEKVWSPNAAPQIFGSKAWPESIKKDFTGQFHKFMASLTETAWDQRGTTTLYIPGEVMRQLSRDEPATERPVSPGARRMRV